MYCTVVRRPFSPTATAILSNGPFACSDLCAVRRCSLRALVMAMRPPARPEGCRAGRRPRGTARPTLPLLSCLRSRGTTSHWMGTRWRSGRYFLSPEEDAGGQQPGPLCCCRLQVSNALQRPLKPLFHAGRACTSARWHAACARRPSSIATNRMRAQAQNKCDCAWAATKQRMQRGRWQLPRLQQAPAVTRPRRQQWQHCQR